MEKEGARAYDLGHWLGGVQARQPGGHHDRDLVAGAAEGLDDEGERPAQMHHEMLRIDGTQFGDRVHHCAAEGIPLGPSLDRGDTVLGRHRRAVAPGQPVADREGVGQLVVADIPPVQHLGPEIALAVHADERIVDQIGKNPRRIDPGDDGIQDLQLGGKRDLQDFVLGTSVRRTDHQCGERAGTGQSKQFHWHLFRGVM